MEILGFVKNNSISSVLLSEFEGETVSLSIKKKRDTRSTRQNAYLHGVVIPYLTSGLNDVGWTIKIGPPGKELELMYDDESTKEDLIKKVFLKKYNKKRTRDLDTKEHEDLMSRLRFFGDTSLGITIPEPKKTLADIYRQSKEVREALGRSNLFL